MMKSRRRSIVFLFIIGSLLLSACESTDVAINDEKDLCADIQCGDNAHCDEGRCECDDGFTGNPVTGCEPETPTMCEGVTCGQNAHCSGGACVCDEGFEGDPSEGCEPILVSCGDVVCGANAHCEEGVCVCDEGFEGDALEGCTPTATDPCEAIACGENAHCEEGACLCDEGFVGDANEGCTPTGPCSGVVCGENAHCVLGACICDEGLTGDPYVGCDEPDEACEGVTCAARAYCDAGECFCYQGYEGDPYDEGCEKVVDPCEDIVCGAYAYCEEGACLCEEGYQGDPYEGCEPDDLCAGVECGPNARCAQGECICLEGYEGDAYDLEEGCTLLDPCENISCGLNAFCDRGECFCEEGYEGNPYEACEEDPCFEVNCDDPNAECNDGQCVCKNGYIEDAAGLCIAVDSCEAIDCGLHAECVETTNGVSCECEAHYENYTPGLGCSPIDYCEGIDCRMVLGAHSHCIVDFEAEGYARCVCDGGYELDESENACALWCADDDYEDNDTWESATDIPVEFEAEGLVLLYEPDNDDVGRYDYYRFYLERNQAIEVSAFFLHEEGDIDLKLFEASSDQSVIYSLSMDDNESFTYSAQRAGEYILFVELYIGGTQSDRICTAYDLLIETIPNPCESDDPPCTGEHELCIFSQAEEEFYECVCDEGYRYNDDGVCEAFCSYDEFEPNDARETASEISLPFNETDLAVSSEKKWDFYRFSVPSDTMLYFAFAREEAAALEISLTKEDESDVIFDEEMEGEGAMQHFVQEGGVFVVGVRYLNYWNAPPCTYYSLDISTEHYPDNPCEETPSVCPDPHHICNFLPGESPDYECNCEEGYDWDAATAACVLWCPEDEFEPNDGVEQPMPIETPAEETGLTLRTGNEDWFAFEAVAAERIEVNLFFAHSEGDVDVKLYHESSLTDAVKIAQSSTDDETLAYSVGALEGMFYLKVYLYNSYTGDRDCTEYDMEIFVGEDFCYDNCTGEHMECDYIDEEPYYECSCDWNYIWNEDETDCIDDPCRSVSCADEYSENAHCEIDWSSPTNYHCVCDEGFIYDAGDGICIYEGCDDDRFEENDRADTATQIVIGDELRNLKAHTGSSHERDYDWYVFELAAGEQAEIHLEFLHDEGDINAAIFDYPAANDSSNYLIAGYSYDDDEYLVFSSETDETYYLRVYVYDRYHCTDYNLLTEIVE